MSTEHVSIVGVGRSGTSLMRNILDCSDEIAIADENYFIGHLLERDGIRHHIRKLGDLNDDAIIAKAVDMIYSRELLDQTNVKNWGYWRWLRDNVPREQLIDSLCATDRSDRQLFIAFLAEYAKFHDKRMVGEKTPAHVLYVKTLMDWFPNGRVIHMVRDPRGNYLSDYTRRRRAKPGSGPLPFRLAARFNLTLKMVVLAVTLHYWRRSIAALHENRNAYPDRYLLVRFEDLITEQDKEVRRICDFLEIKFSDGMLAQSVVRGENKGDQGFDKTKTERWRDDIDGWVNRIIKLRFGKRMKELGYE